MATLYVRNFPDELYERVKAAAAERHRSVAAEVTVIVEQALKDEEAKTERRKALEALAEIRRRNPQPEGAIDTTALLREDRDR